MSSTTEIAATASVTPTVDTSNFGNNAFSDFAPLLILFGDDFTKQFLATSMGWADDILIGIAPIGIVTVVLCAIRIGGNQFLKSLIGRARDSPDDDEKEILSSTSKNVREIWNGERVVRQTGESKMIELVYDPAWDATPLPTSRPANFKYNKPVISFVEAVGPDKFKMNQRYQVDERQPDNKIFKSFFKSFSKSPEVIPPFPWELELQKKAPNLTLNIDGTIPAPRKVLLYMALGLLIQAVIMAFNATAVYYLRWPRSGSVVAAYGYPVWAVGTVCISLGVSVCAQVVQHRTSQYIFRPGPGDSILRSGLRVVRLQSQIANSNIPAFAIWQSEGNHLIHVSIRHTRNTIANITASTRTIIGTLLTMAGFVLQNVGTRELHWSAGVSQLGATLLLAVIRALLRHHVGDYPKPAPVRLPEGVESDTLVTNLESKGCCILSERPILFHPLAGKRSRSDREQYGEKEEWDDRPGLDSDFMTSQLAGFNNPEQRASEVSSKVLRMLVLQYELSNWVPERKEICETTHGLCKAMKETCLFLLGNGSEPSSKLSWTQYMILSKARTLRGVDDNNKADRQILGIGLTAGDSSLDDGELGFTRRLIQSIISLSWHYYSTNESDPTAPRKTKGTTQSFWILASGTQEEIKEREAQVTKLIPDLASWRRDNYCVFRPKSQLRVFSPAVPQTWIRDERVFECFGLRHSSLFKNDPESNYELFCTRYITNPPETSLLQSLAIDIFSTFLLDLVTKNRIDLERKFGKEIWNNALMPIGNFLTEYKVCDTDVDKKLAIIPALLALGVRRADVLVHLDGDEIGKKRE